MWRTAGFLRVLVLISRINMNVNQKSVDQNRTVRVFAFDLAFGSIN
jgi:hypothetical protein